MDVNKIGPSDYEEVLELNEAEVPHVGSIGTEQLDWFAHNASFTRLIRIDGRLAGFIIGMRPGTSYQSPNYRWFCDNYDDFAYVDRIAVSSWARRKGIAETLYEAFAEAESDAPVMTCEVNIRPSNEGSMRFHERMGFRQVGSQQTEGGKKEVAMLEKKL